jgi:surface antigen
MTLDEFFAKYDGQFVDYDAVSGPQCVDVIKQYKDEVLGLPAPALGNAKDYWNNESSDFERIQNSSTAVPQKGDIVIWGTGIGPYGHIAIATGTGDTSSFESFDQNFPLNSPCRFVKHNYNSVIGWLRPPNIPTGGSMDDVKLHHCLRNIVNEFYLKYYLRKPESDKVIEDHVAWMVANSGSAFNFPGPANWVAGQVNTAEFKTIWMKKADCIKEKEELRKAYESNIALLKNEITRLETKIDETTAAYESQIVSIRDDYDQKISKLEEELVTCQTKPCPPCPQIDDLSGLDMIRLGIKKWLGIS